MPSREQPALPRIGLYCDGEKKNQESVDLQSVRL